MTPLLERLAAIREQEVANDPCPRSVEGMNTPSPLSIFLIIFSRATHECYIDYNAGTIALARWLTFPNTPLDLEVDKYPRIEDTSFKVPRLLSGYESNEVGKILAGKPTTCVAKYFKESARFERAIYFTAIDLVERGELYYE